MARRMSWLEQAEQEEQRTAALAAGAAGCSFGVGVIERTGKKGEDRAAVVPRFTGRAGDDYVGCFDGHRGASVATHAASTLHCELAARLAEHEENRARSGFVHAACAAAFERCHEAARQQHLHDGAAALCLFTLRGEAWCANAGDCRAVLCPGAGPPRRLSCDHKASEPAETARIEAAGGTVEFGSLEGMLELSRGLGDFDFCAAGYSQKPHVAGPLVLAADDAVLLASDGVWDVFTDEDACDFVRRRLANGLAPTAICCAIVQQAAALGSRDDKTAVLVTATRPPEPPAAPAASAPEAEAEPPRTPGPWDTDG